METIVFNYDRSPEQEALMNQANDLAKRIGASTPNMAASFLPEIKQIIDAADLVKTPGEGLTKSRIYDNLIWTIKRELDFETIKYKLVLIVMEENKEMLLSGGHE